jgi:hypothetical protein
MSNVITKAVASVEPVETDQYPNGAFDIILSAQTKDRDGDTLTADQWKMPLPEHITMDADHGMSVATTVGSGKPFINDDGDLQVRGTYSSIPRAQEVRALVNEGHIKTTSVAFMVDKSTKGAKSERELLNGAFVSIPSNREAVILSSKAFAEVKVGARNSATDAQHIQSIHDSAMSLGAACASGEADGANKALGAVAETDTSDEASPADLASAVDAALDEACALLADVDPATLPPAVAQALALVQAASASADALLESLGVADPDDPDAPADAPAGTPAEKSAAGTAADDAAEVELKGRALLILATSRSL